MDAARHDEMEVTGLVETAWTLRAAGISIVSVLQTRDGFDCIK